MSVVVAICEWPSTSMTTRQRNIIRATPTRDSVDDSGRQGGR